MANEGVNALAAEVAAGIHDERTKKPTRTEKISIEQHSISGVFWVVGWLFTVGFLHLPFWKGLLALLVWPYYLGTTLAPPV